MARIFRPLLFAAIGVAAAQCREAPPTAPVLITHLPRELTAAEGRLVTADNRFAFKLFRQIAESVPPDSSLFVSPFHPRKPFIAPQFSRVGTIGRSRRRMSPMLPRPATVTRPNSDFPKPGNASKSER